MTTLVPPLLITIGVFLISVGLFASQRRNPVAERLTRMSAKPATLAELELQTPFRERVIKPLLQWLGSTFSHQVQLVNYQDIALRLDRAGNPGGLGPQEFFAVKLILSASLGALVFLIADLGFDLLFPVELGFAVVVLFLGYRLPDFWIGTRASARQSEISSALADTVDLLSIGVSAGLSFDGAIRRVCQKWDNALTQELTRVLSEMQMGRSRVDALREMAERVDIVEVTSFIASILQATQLGVSVLDTLHSQGRLLRQRHRQNLEKEAHQAGVKMLIPVVFFMFPALMVVIIGPAIPGLMSSFVGPR